MIKKREKNWKSILGVLSLSLMVVLVSCDDDDPVEVERVDEDAAFNEFNNTTFFDDNDVNTDGSFDNNEFNGSFFTSFDLNNNNFIEEDEFNTSRGNFRANTTTNFTDLDANNDSRLEIAEFQSDFEANNFFGDFDADVNNTITAREFSDGVFVRWDNDNDGFIDRNDFDTRFNMHFRTQ